MARVPRGLMLRFSFGRPFGAPGHPLPLRVAREDARNLLVTAPEPGKLESRLYRRCWEDYRRTLAARHGG